LPLVNAESGQELSIDEYEDDEEEKNKRPRKYKRKSRRMSPSNSSADDASRRYPYEPSTSGHFSGNRNNSMSKQIEHAWCIQLEVE